MNEFMEEIFSINEKQWLYVRDTNLVRVNGLTEKIPILRKRQRLYIKGDDCTEQTLDYNFI